MSCPAGYRNLGVAFKRLPKWGIAMAVWMAAGGAWGVILMETSDPTANTTAPTGEYADSGWQYQGRWGNFLGTVISPNCFITAG
jgi:hypothetical protein